MDYLLFVLPTVVAWDLYFRFLLLLGSSLAHDFTALPVTLTFLYLYLISVHPLPSVRFRLLFLSSLYLCGRGLLLLS